MIPTLTFTLNIPAPYLPKSSIQLPQKKRVVMEITGAGKHSQSTTYKANFQKRHADEGQYYGHGY